MVNFRNVITTITITIITIIAIINSNGNNNNNIIIIIIIIITVIMIILILTIIIRSHYQVYIKTNIKLFARTDQQSAKFTNNVSNSKIYEDFIILINIITILIYRKILV